MAWYTNPAPDDDSPIKTMTSFLIQTKWNEALLRVLECHILVNRALRFNCWGYSNETNQTVCSQW